MIKRTLLAAVAAALVAACGGDGGGTTGPQTLNISGTWTFSDNISSATAGISCNSSGNATLTQSGSNFTGTVNATTGVCTDSFGGSVDNTGTQSVTGGQISGTSVSFQVPFCQLSGSVSGNPANAMSGSETCTLDIGGTSYQFTGTWQASR